MRFGATANPQQVAMMANVVDAYCRQAGIEPENPERERVAARIIALYEIGVRGQNDLLAALTMPPSAGGATTHRVS